MSTKHPTRQRADSIYLLSDAQSLYLILVILGIGVVWLAAFGGVAL